MEELEKIKAWLMGYPGWQGGLTIDDTGPGFGVGLFPMGQQVLHRQEDVVGNCYTRIRSTCQLKRVCPVAEGAVWMADFARWVQAQCAQGGVPGLGDIPKTETVSAVNGRLQKRDAGGTATYTIDLVWEYTKVYKAEG